MENENPRRMEVDARTVLVLGQQNQHVERTVFEHESPCSTGFFLRASIMRIEGISSPSG